MCCFVYVLGCRDKVGARTYVGWTTDLEARLVRHNGGTGASALGSIKHGGTGAKSTRGRVWVLLYAERYHFRHEAMSREWYLKRDRSFRKRLAGHL